MHQKLLGNQSRVRSVCGGGVCPCLATSRCQHVQASHMPSPLSVPSVIFSCVPASTGIMLGRMGDSGAPLVSFCQCLNESVMKIVAVAVW